MSRSTLATKQRSCLVANVVRDAQQHQPGPVWHYKRPVLNVAASNRTDLVCLRRLATATEARSSAGCEASGKGSR